jgi:aspartate-semialdehyde dehydrogenase
MVRRREPSEHGSLLRRFQRRVRTRGPQTGSGKVSEKVDIGILGATGTVGERLVRLLHAHPWFRLIEAGASERSAGSKLGDLIGSNEDGDLAEEISQLEVKSLEGPFKARVLLSALPSGVAGPLETKLAAAGHLVVSNASSHRMTRDVPLIVPELNADHLGLLRAQGHPNGGGLLTNPNCAVTAFVMPLAALKDAFGIERVVVTTFQSISGAGKPGPSAGDLIDNVIPLIPGEEEKVAAEPRKILGRLASDHIEDAEFIVSATATRVPVAHGHLASVSVTLSKAASPEECAEAMRAFRSAIAKDGLPSSPEHALEVMDQPNRPQPRLDRDRGAGMTATVGRIRKCEVGHVKFIALSHNLLRGAAGAALLNAELCHARGLTKRPSASARTETGQHASAAAPA